MSDAKIVNIARLLTTYTFEIDELSDNLKCTQCNLVLKDSCQVPCGCRFCRTCIEDMIASGDEFCPGAARDCAESRLFLFSPDYRANNKISRLTAKCPYYECMSECQLIDMEEHLRECQNKNEECPYSQFGCTWDKCSTENIDEHLQQGNRRHSEILIETIANINKEVKVLKYDSVLKDRQIRTIVDRIMHMENDKDSITNCTQSGENRTEQLSGGLMIWSGNTERELDQRCEHDELDIVIRVIEHEDRDVVVTTGLIGSNFDDVDIEMMSPMDKTALISEGEQSTTYNNCGNESHMQLIQSVLQQVDARCEWMTENDVRKTRWNWGDRPSDYFTGSVRPHQYKLDSANVKGIAGELYFMLLIYREPADESFVWPFEGRLIVTVTDRHRHHLCRSIPQQYRVEGPLQNDCKRVNSVMFRHSDLERAGLDLNDGLRVSCAIVLDDW